MNNWERYLSYLGLDHWATANKVMRYLWRLINYMLVYKKVEHLDVIRYSDANFSNYNYDFKSTSRYIFRLIEKAIS